jgi:DNA polymerase/3'-5' exonuclease PolX
MRLPPGVTEPSGVIAGGTGIGVGSGGKVEPREPFASSGSSMKINGAKQTLSKKYYEGISTKASRTSPTPYLEHLRRDARKPRVLNIVGLGHLALIRLVERVRVQHDKTKRQNVRLIYPVIQSIERTSARIEGSPSEANRLGLHSAYRVAKASITRSIC